MKGELKWNHEIRKHIGSEQNQKKDGFYEKLDSEIKRK